MWLSLDSGGDSRQPLWPPAGVAGSHRSQFATILAGLGRGWFVVISHLSVRLGLASIPSGKLGGGGQVAVKREGRGVGMRRGPA